MGKGKGKTDFGEVFEDVMSYMEKKLGKEDFETDADLRDYIQRGDTEGKISNSVLSRMSDTQEWKNRISGKESESGDYEVLGGKKESKKNVYRFDSRAKRYRDNRGRFVKRR